jgi:GH3 auxin-responsive promoter
MFRISQYLWYPLLLGSATAIFVLMRTMDINLLATTYLPILVTGGALVALKWTRPPRASWRPTRDEVWGDALYMLGVPIILPRTLMLSIVNGLGKVRIGFDVVFALAPADEEHGRYDIYLETDTAACPDANVVAASLDTALQQLNVEFAGKRAGERLPAPRLWWLRMGCYETLRAWACKRGQREAQFKVMSLDYRARFAFDIGGWVAKEQPL